MVQFRVLTGSRQGERLIASRFPWLIGRSTTAQLRLEDPGVWERHLEVNLNEPDGFSVSLLPGALATLNGTSFQQARLRNGDLLEVGSVQLQFWLSEVPQKGLRWREALTWLALGVLCLVQILLVYLLER
jgi:pSer/pThr/pTyr-binding forkhead associated (FHA) protein